MTYLASVNTPGYLPDSEDPAVFDTAREAWWYLYHERCASEMNAPCDLCRDTMTHGPNGDCDDDTETGDALSHNARAGVIEGTVYGPTPGYDGDHDLGLAYTVSTVEVGDADAGEPSKYAAMTDAEIVDEIGGF